MFDKNALVQALVSKGYNQIDAQNAAGGPRASELAKEYLGVSSGNTSGGSASDAAQKILDAQKATIDRETAFVSKYTSDNPFVFDEIAARNASKAEYDPYYSQQIDRYLQNIGVNRDSIQSDEKLKTALGTTSMGTAGQANRAYTQTVESAKQGYANTGGYFGGAAKRALGVGQVERNQQINTQATGIGNTVNDVNQNEQTAVEGGVLQRQGEAYKGYYTPLIQSYYRQFPTDSGGVLNGYIPPDYLRL